MPLAYNARRPQWWCDNCDLALYEHEAIAIEHPAAQGCAGATTLVVHECSCGCELDEYKFQDDAEVTP